MKLLLVDDDAFLRDMYAIKFGESGFDVDIAENAEQALSKIEQETEFEIVLTDMVMPGMSGIELITEIKKLQSKKEPCMIVLSNQGQESDVADATKVGADGYIVKAEAIPSDVVKKVTNIYKKYKK